MPSSDPSRRSWLGWKPAWVKVGPKERRARLRTVHRVLLLIVGFYLVHAIVFGHLIAGWIHGVSLVLLGINEGLRTRWNRVDLAGWIVIGMTAFTICSCALIDGQSDSWIPWMLPVVPILCGQLFGNRPMMVSGVVVSVLAVLVLVSDYFVTIPREYPGNQVDLLALRVANLGICCAISIDAKRTFGRQIAALSQQARQIDEVRRERDDARRSASVFMSTMSHHIRQPIAALVANSRQLCDNAGEGLASQTQESLKCAMHLQRLVGDVLDLAALEHGALSLQMHRMSIGELCGEIEAWYGKKGSSRIPLKVSGLNDTRSFEVDRARVLLICERLLENAIKFSDARVIELSIEMERGTSAQETVNIRVADDGRGIPQALLDPDSQQFALCGDSQANQDRGAGLSLVLVRRLARAMGASLSFSRYREDQGTVVEICLPTLGLSRSEHDSEREAA